MKTRNPCKNKYEVVRAMWSAWRISVIDGFERIPELYYPSQTTEMRAFSGCVGLQRVKLEAPGYLRPHLKIREFDRYFRNLSKDQQKAMYYKFVLEFNNSKISRLVKCTEGAIRYRLKKSEQILINSMGKIKFSENKLKIID